MSKVVGDFKRGVVKEFRRESNLGFLSGGYIFFYGDASNVSVKDGKLEWCPLSAGEVIKKPGFGDEIIFGCLKKKKFSFRRIASPWTTKKIFDDAQEKISSLSTSKSVL